MIQCEPQLPTLSVIMPNYNHARFLPESLTAILAQSYRPVEVLVADDASTDNSVEIIEAFVRKDPLIRLVRNERNLGVVHNANRLLQLASGDYVYCAAADDLVLPGLFQKSMELLARYPEAGLCSSMIEIVDAASGKEKNTLLLEKIAKQERFIPPGQGLEWLRLHESWILGNTCIYRLDALQKAGGFIPELHSFCDGFIEMVLALKYGACFIPEPLAIFRLSVTGYSASTKSNLDHILKIYSHAAELMRTTYADLFPSDFVNVWENKNLHLYRLSALRNLQKQQMTIVKGFWDHENLVDRVFSAGLWVGMRTQYFSLISYLLVRFWREMWPVAMRKVRVVLQRLSISWKI